MKYFSVRETAGRYRPGPPLRARDRFDVLTKKDMESIGVTQPLNWSNVDANDNGEVELALAA